MGELTAALEGHILLYLSMPEQTDAAHHVTRLST